MNAQSREAVTEPKFLIKLHDSEQKLIKFIRAYNSGEISIIKIQNGLPVTFYISQTGRSLHEANF